MNGSWKYTRNLYTGDAEGTNNIHSSNIYVFTQLAGRLKQLTYLAGLGISDVKYHQGTTDYSKWLWRPKVSLAYSPVDGMILCYDFELSQQVSTYAMTSDVCIRQNSREWLLGNPDLKPTARYSHQLNLSYEKPRWGNSIYAEYRLNRDANMEHYMRTDDGKFVLTQTNQRGVDMWYVQDYAHFDILPGHLMLSVNGGIYRFYSKGDNYTHVYTFCGWGTSLQGYFGKWSFMLYADNGWRYVEGEHRGHNHSNLSGSVGYRMGACTLRLSFQNPFRTPTTTSSEVLNTLVHKTSSTINSDMGNVIRLSLSWRFSKGHQLKASQRTMKNEDKITGIMQ